MTLFNAIVFGAFVGFLSDYWLGRAGVRDQARLIVSVVVAVVVALLVVFDRVAVF